MHMSLRMTRKCLMLRQKGALCWDMALKLKHIGFMILKKKKVIFSRDVVFDETKNVTHEDDDPSNNELAQSLFNWIV